MEHDFIRSIPCTREQTPVVVPKWLQEYAQAWGAQGAAAVVLFGSRAQGRALTISDWDVAVVFLDEDEVPKSNSVRLSDSVSMRHEVNPLLAPLNKLNLALLREIESGICLYGDFKLLCREYYEKHILTVDRTELIRLIANCYKDSLKSLLAITTEWQVNGQSIPPANLFSDDGESHSAGAAERGVKALCCIFGLTYKYTHNVLALAEQVPPDWFELVMSLNGPTDDAHTSSYIDEFHESCADSLNRIDRTLDLLDRILYLGLFIPIEEEMQHLFREIDRSTKGHQNLLAESDVEPHCSDLYRRLACQLKKIKQIAIPQDKPDPK